MTDTGYDEVTEIIDELLAGLRINLRDELIGLYLYGSLVTGDFDEAVSDIDLLVVVHHEINDDEYALLDRMHRHLPLDHPKWDNRIDVQYWSTKALSSFRTEPCVINVISPGEPFHRRTADTDWLINWSIVCEQGRTLTGPPPDTLIAPISKEQYKQTVYSHVVHWANWLDDSTDVPGQSYAILTLCRALYSLQYGVQASKLAASERVIQTWPQWRDIIERARKWRVQAVEDTIEADAADVLPDTLRFVEFATAQADTIYGAK